MNPDSPRTHEGDDVAGLAIILSRETAERASYAIGGALTCSFTNRERDKRGLAATWITDKAEATLRDLDKAIKDALAIPVKLVLACPLCATFHVDEGDWATRPHKTHRCLACDYEWRPCEVPTVGIAASCDPQKALIEHAFAQHRIRQLRGDEAPKPNDGAKRSSDVLNPALTRPVAVEEREALEAIVVARIGSHQHCGVVDDVLAAGYRRPGKADGGAVPEDVG